MPKIGVVLGVVFGPLFGVVLGALVWPLFGVVLQFLTLRTSKTAKNKLVLVYPKHHSATQTGVAEVVARGKNCPGEVFVWCGGVVLWCGVGVVWWWCGVVVLWWCGVVVWCWGCVVVLWCCGGVVVCWGGWVGPKELRNWKP
jgi:hypothetical protein